MALADHIEGTPRQRPRRRRHHRLPHRRGGAATNWSRFAERLDRTGPARGAVIEAQLPTLPTATQARARP